jgi:hypothetical protein
MDIAALKYPPCPNPPASRVDCDTSLILDEEFDTQKSCEAVPQATRLTRNWSTGENVVTCAQQEIRIDMPRRPCKDCNGREDDFDKESIIQPFPSSASIWGVDSFKRVHGSVVTDKHSVNGRLCSPISLKPVLGTQQHYSGNSPPLFSQARPPCKRAVIHPPAKPISSQHQTLSVDRTLQEKLTLSLLAAMNERDFQGVASQESRQRERKGSTSLIPWRSAAITVRGFWRKLRFW